MLTMGLKTILLYSYLEWTYMSEKHMIVSQPDRKRVSINISDLFSPLKRAKIPAEDVMMESVRHLLDLNNKIKRIDKCIPTGKK